MSHIQKNTRVVFLLVSVALLAIIHWFLTGSWRPTTTTTTFVFQNLVLMIVLGSTLVESKFTKPADAFVNGLAVAITLLSLPSPSTFIAWKANLGLALVIVLCAIVSILIGTEEQGPDSPQNHIARAFYVPAVFFGRSSLLFSVTFILAIFSYFASQSREFLLLMLFWAFIVVAEPIGLLALVQRFTESIRSTTLRSGGRISGAVLPGVFRFEPHEGTRLRSGEFVAIKDEDVTVAVVTTSYHFEGTARAQAIAVQRIAPDKWQGESLNDGHVYVVGDKEALKARINDPAAVGRLKNFAGVVVENSSIGEIVFRASGDVDIEEGYILEANVRGKQVLYQIVNAKTDTDLVGADLKSGIVRGIAQQVGVWDPAQVRFDKFAWVPSVHTPLFLLDKSVKVDHKIGPNEFVLGYIPNTNYPLIANITTLVSHHTAILGITGSGKTEIAFTLVQKMAETKAKVFCVDFTGDYIDEFKGLNPQRLSISEAQAKELNEKLLAAETGAYGAGAEIKALEQLKAKLIPEIKKIVEEFIASERSVGVFELSEISNTSATIAITELYLSQIFAYARQHRQDRKQFCIVLEEAHTIIPESQTMGTQDKFSRATIGKISQIALQGRKYNVGLLVIAQRTANVTKTVLNQCNSVIVFNSYDKTGFDFLENYVGPGMISAIPNLKRLHSMVVGRGFKAGRPIIMEIPFKEKFKAGKDCSRDETPPETTVAAK